MLFAILIRADADTEAGKLPDTSLLTAMTAFNKTLVEAGILITGDGLTPSSEGARLSFSGGASPPTITNGPFPVQELVCGFWLLDCKDLEEAVGWMEKCPMGKGAVIEIRPGYRAEDFGDALTDELRREEEELRKGELLSRKV